MKGGFSSSHTEVVRPGIGMIFGCGSLKPEEKV